jgi:Ser/Thr protein kinase RdoA (MazF antagonist)
LSGEPGAAGAPLPDETVRAVLRRYDIPTRDVELVNVSENIVYRVGEPQVDSTMFLRVHRPRYNSITEIASELSWIAALRRDAGVLTPDVATARDGSRFVVVEDAVTGPRVCVLFRGCPGVEPGVDDGLAASFERLGEVSASIHRHSERWTPPPWFHRRTWNYDTTLGDRPQWGRWSDRPDVGEPERALLRRAAFTIQERLAVYGSDPARYGLVHADMRLANVLLDGPRTYVIDFDDCGYSWYLYDLATALTLIEDAPHAPELVDAWLRGYQHIRALDRDDLAVIPCLVVLRRILVMAWLASHADTELARSEGANHTRVTCDLVDRYLSGSLSYV